MISRVRRKVCTVVAIGCSLVALFLLVELRARYTNRLVLEQIKTLSDSLDLRASEKTCSALIQGDKKTQEQAIKSVKNLSAAADDYFTETCDVVRSEYITDFTFLPPEEQAMSIAFGIVTYDHVLPQLNQLLRAIYRPHHHYCIHVDGKSSDSTYEAVNRLASCFSNVHVPKQRMKITWGGLNQVKAELLCMDVLHDASEKWRYYINLSGQEFPLKTMWQLTRILMALNGSNSMEGTVERMNADRRHQFEPFRQKYNVTAVKGAVHIVVVRGYVNYALNSPVANAMLDHLDGAPNPDETFFSTLNHNPQLKVPGAYLGEPETDEDTYPFINRFKVWEWDNVPCNGYYRNAVCVWGVLDLPFIAHRSRKELFLNKLFWDFQHLTMDCLDWWHWNRTIEEYKSYWTGSKSVQFDAKFYENLASSKNHIPE